MTPEKMLDALNELDSRFLREAREEKAGRSHMKGRRFTALIAAVIALMAMTVTAFASEAVAGWFRQFFAGKAPEELTPGQIAFIEENEQIIAETKEENGWMVELRSAISDGTKAYFIIGVTAPEGTNLVQRVDDDGSIKDWFGPGNSFVGLGDVISISIPEASLEGNYYYQGSYCWRDDGDGLTNTMNMVYELGVGRWKPGEDCSLKEPFGADVDFNIHIENIVREYDDEEYYQELMNGKYAGQTDVMFTHEETQRLKQVEVLVEGAWNFTVNFGKSEAGVELLSHPITVNAWVWDEGDPNDMFDGKRINQNVTIKSFILNPLSALIECEEPNASFEDMYAVLKDGTKILLNHNGVTVDAQSPIAIEEVDHILLADGTKIPMPE